MTVSRNDECPCASGKKFKKCCGAPKAPPSGASAPAPPRFPVAGVRALDRLGAPTPGDPLEAQVFALLRKGNLAQAEPFLRARLRRRPNDARALRLVEWIAAEANIPAGGVSAATSAHAGERFLLIKAWGFGFWSDVSHVLGQLLVARLTGRMPVVHWGANSLFSTDATSNAWLDFFEPLSKVTLEDLVRLGGECWPPKWTAATLAVPEIAKSQGQWSRVPGIRLLGRCESVVVSDFFTSILELMPWIAPADPLHGKSVHEIARLLMREHLRPCAAHMDAANAFVAAQLPSAFLAVHARGSDKALEHSDLARVNREYHEHIDAHLTAHPADQIFLMTDDSRVLADYRARHGDKIVVTECERTSNDTGVHYQQRADPRQLGVEVLVDALIATRARAFIGNGFSNASVMVRYLADWPEGTVTLIGQSLFETPNSVLHDW